MEATTLEYSESTTVTLEWTLNGLKNLFDSSKGDAKSKVTKSARFGLDGCWQVLFYANSGSSNGGENSGHISLYLSCEPTPEEKEAGANGKWVREGLYNFMFQLRPPGKGFVFNQKEAHNRTFSSKSPNLGWGQFAHRDFVYYHAPTVRNTDAFVITCTITSNGAPPAPPPAVPKQTVPRDLMNSISSLLDDPLYSDVEFVFPRPEGAAKRIYAASKLLKRCDYFDSMFNSGFMEASQADSNLSYAHHDSTLTHTVGDSDVDDDEELAEGDVEDNHLEVQVEGVTTRTDADLSAAEHASEEPDPDTEGPPRNRPRLSLPSSPLLSANRGRGLSLGQSMVLPAPPMGPSKMKVIVRDSSYWTYRAMLNYMYTDSIVFAPLSTSFIQPAKPDVVLVEPAAAAAIQTPAAEERPSFNFTAKSTQSTDTSLSSGPKSRREWIEDWEVTNPGRPRPCSAKAIYRLADRLDLSELKSRAFQHIVKSLTTANIAYEVFSTFSATYEEVRKPMITFFLDNWSDVRGSEAMRHVWQQIRLGGHPGFEEVWPLIALNLEFKLRPVEEAPAEAAANT